MTTMSNGSRKIERIKTCLTQTHCSLSSQGTQAPGTPAPAREGPEGSLQWQRLSFSNPQPSDPPLLHCSCTFNTGRGHLLIPYGQAPSRSHYSGGPSSVCHSHCFVCRQAYPEPVDPERVGAHGFTYNPSYRGRLWLRLSLFYSAV